MKSYTVSILLNAPGALHFFLSLRGGGGGGGGGGGRHYFEPKGKFINLGHNTSNKQ